MPKKAKTKVTGDSPSKRLKTVRSQESPEQKEKRLTNEKQRAQHSRTNRAPGEIIVQQTNRAITYQCRKSNENETQKRQRLNKNAIDEAKKALNKRYNAVCIEINETDTKYDEIYLGLLEFECPNCQAKHFKDEKPSDGKYSSCCHKGKVQLQPLEVYPDFFKNLLTNKHEHSKNFKENIRIYNSSVAFASMGAQIEAPPGRGPFVFRIHGQIYHRTSTSITPREGQQPQFAQLYILDSCKALEQRMGMIEKYALIPNLEHQLDIEIRQLNPFAKAFKMMAELEKQEEAIAQEENRTIHPVTMSISREIGDDKRRYNNPTSNEVAIIFQSTDGEPPFDRDIKIHYKDDRGLQHISILNPDLDPMVYPILFPSGERGWHTQMNLIDNRSSRMSQLQYYAYRLAIRDIFNPILNSGKLTQQFIVDTYVKIEANRLNYYRTHQKDLRVEQYKGLLDHVEEYADNKGMKAGIPVILPSSFMGSPRNLAQNYQDAMAIVAKFGKPDLFITMTCNPKWKELTENLNTWQKIEHRPDLVARVFQLKKKALLKDITAGILGVPIAKIHVIEFQKRGLPHMHLLLILKEEDKPRAGDLIDKLVWAEIPEKDKNPRLRQIVLDNMVHGPCGKLNASSPCMQGQICTKNYPKELQLETNADINGYPKYRRREIPGVVEADRIKRGNIIDNSWIVPYNPYLLLKYNCHINTEICASIKGVKYLFKYIYKGYDCARVDLTETCSSSGEDLYVKNEIKSFVDSRYISPPEAMWRIREQRLYEHSHVIIRLAVHLHHENSVYFYSGKEEEALEKAARKHTTLTAWFELNKNDSEASTLLYTEIPQYYVYDSKAGKWNIRKQGREKVISRMYSVSPRQKERYFLRLILLHVKGAKSFQDLHTVDGEICNSFQEAAVKLGLLEDDSEWDRCLSEAANFKMPRELRHLFSYICLHCNPENALALWCQYKLDMIEDFQKSYSEPIAIMHALAEIQKILIIGGQNLANFGLPIPPSDLVTLDDEYVVEHELLEANKLVPTLTEEQKKIFDEIVRAVNDSSYSNRLHFVDGVGGSGKTHLYTTIIHYLRANGKRVCPVAPTGIASNLLIGGRTYFSAFGLPVPLLEVSVSQIRASTIAGKFLKATDLIIFDEASMASNIALTKIDQYLRDLKDDQRPFGGTVLLMGGDFRQQLNIIKHAHRVAVVQSTIKFHPLWTLFMQHKLTANKRAQQDPKFCDWLLKLGDGDLPTNDTLDTIEIPTELIEHGNIVSSIYGDSIKIIDVKKISNRAILCPKNVDVQIINEEVEKLLEGETTTYSSVDSVAGDDIESTVNFPVEFLNTITPSGMGPHLLKIKVGSIVILLRNLNTKNNLCNGTRLIVKHLQPHLIKCEIISGNGAGQSVFLPRIDLTTLESEMPFQLKRRQFPVKLAWCMTISKSQGQTFDRVGIYLPNSVFSHGQLYVACSRVRCQKDLKLQILDTEWQGKLDPQYEKYYTRNVVYKEVFT